MLPRPGAAARTSIGRVLSLADDEADEDDLRLRKRIGVAAGYLTVVAPLTLPLLAQGLPIAVIVGVALSAFSVVNLVVLARTHRFERFVIALVSAGCIFVPIASWLSGGITLASAGLVWSFLIPGYALLALGPASGARWYGAFLGVIAGAVVLELVVRQPIAAPPYPVQLIGAVVNTVVPLSIAFAMLLYSDRRRREAEARSEALLTNVIPASIARRLKRGEQHIADIYPETTILFADLAGFTPWARATAPTRVAAALDGLFSRFDRLIASAGMEKIKTIGDAYMAVAGAPEPRADHAVTALDVALRMLEAADAWRVSDDVPLELRIGLASGSVAGGVIGERRFLFDLWGDAVNEAARMESTGEPGHVHFAESTRRLLTDDLQFVLREIDVKGMGSMRTYLVARRG
jgi:class 3 adenylate cyclase